MSAINHQSTTHIRYIKWKRDALRTLGREHGDGLGVIPPVYMLVLHLPHDSNVDGRTSGVLSLTANPVPPLTIIRLTQLGPSVQSQMARWMSSTLSGTIFVTGCCQVPGPSVENTVVRVSDTRSVDGSWEAVSDTTRIAAFRVLSAMLRVGC